MPRPNLIADPITAFGKRKPLTQEGEKKREISIVQRLKAEVKAMPLSRLKPLEPYKSPRDHTRDKVYNELRYHQRVRESDGLTPYLTDKYSLDVILPRVHGANKFSNREFRGPIY